jgi:hypothetical protein
MRLGLALHKSRQEVRDLPVTEYHDWELMYMLEPWGWQEQEYRFGKLLAEMWGIAHKGRKQFKPIDFMRDLTKWIFEVQPTDMTPEELKVYRKEHRDEIRASFKRAFGVK